MKKFILLVVSSYLSASFLFSQTRYELQYKLQPQPIRYKFSTYAEGVQEAEGTRIVSERTMQGLVSLKFIAETAQQLTFEMVYDSLEMTAVSEVGETVLQNPSEVINLRIKKVIARTGDQIASDELDEFGFLPAALSFSTDNEFLPNLPNKAITQNQITKTEDIDTVYIATDACLNEKNIEYKFVGREVLHGYDCVKLEINGSAKLSGDFSRHGTQFYLAGEGAISGLIFFSPEKGLLVSSSNQTRLHLNIMTAGDEPVSIPVIQNSRSEIDLYHDRMN